MFSWFLSTTIQLLTELRREGLAANPHAPRIKPRRFDCPNHRLWNPCAPFERSRRELKASSLCSKAGLVKATVTASAPQ